MYTQIYVCIYDKRWCSLYSNVAALREGSNFTTNVVSLSPMRSTCTQIVIIMTSWCDIYFLL